MSAAVQTHENLINAEVKLMENSHESEGREK